MIRDSREMEERRWREDGETVERQQSEGRRWQRDSREKAERQKVERKQRNRGMAERQKKKEREDIGNWVLIVAIN